MPFSSEEISLFLYLILTPKQPFLPLFLSIFGRKADNFGKNTYFFGRNALFFGRNDNNFVRNTHKWVRNGYFLPRNKRCQFIRRHRFDYEHKMKENPVKSRR